MATDSKSAPTLEPGDVLLGRYVVDRQVAEGGMAAIHRTHDEATGETVAIKVLYPFYDQNPVVCTRFLDEGRIQRYLDHPNIIDVYDIVEKPQLAIVMEYIDGPTLDDYLDDHGPLTLPELLNLMIPVLSAVGFAHHKGVIHRDIKPSNILLAPTPSGLVPKIMDFGVAKVDRRQDLTATGTTVGTLHYMSPEQIVGSHDIDGRADIYSLGVTIYKLCTGDVPFNASTEFALMMAQVEAPPTPPSKLRQGVPPRLEAVILKALAKKTADRYQTVKELTSALLEIEDDTSYDQTDTDTAPVPPELLEYAMLADEIAVDRTGKLDITQVAQLIEESAETEKDLSPPSGIFDTTLQLDAARLEAKMSKDSEPQTHEIVADGGELDVTAPQEHVAPDTHLPPSKRPVDSTERTRPFPEPDAPAAQSSDALAPPTDEQHLSQQKTRPYHPTPPRDVTAEEEPDSPNRPRYVLWAAGVLLFFGLMTAVGWVLLASG